MLGLIAGLIGLCAGAGLTTVVLRLIHAAAIGDLTARLRAVEDQARKAEADLLGAERRCRELEDAALRDAGSWKAEKTKLETELEAERKAAQEKLEALTEVREDLLARVSKEAGIQLSVSGQQLVDMSKRQKAVEDLVKPMADTMKQMDEAMTTIDRDRRKSHVELREGLKAATEAQKELRTETGVLSRALRKPESRGRWGEMHLKRLLELAGMSPYCDFTEQVRVDDEGTTLRPDLVVHLPSEKDIVIDAKAPLAPYLDACEATDDSSRSAYMKLYARGVRAHVKKLASKDYASQFESAPDFVLMYMPGEHFFSAAVETDPSLIEDALSDGVLIATPTTLLVMLKTVAHSWQQERVAEEAQAIATLGAQLYERLVVFLTHADLVSKRLNSTVDAQNKMVGSLERMILPTARRFPELGAVAADRRLPEARQVTQTARQVQARELGAFEGEVAGLEPADSAALAPGNDSEQEAA